jgi:hypothetical protein
MAEEKSNRSERGIVFGLYRSQRHLGGWEAKEKYKPAHVGVEAVHKCPFVCVN